MIRSLSGGLMGVAVFVVAFCLAVAGSGELVVNGGFEEGNAPWGPGITDDTAHGGKYSIKLDNSQGRPWAAVAYTKTIPLKPHVPYRVTVWIKRKTGDGYLEIGGYPVDVNGERLKTGRSWTMVFFPVKVMTGQALGEWTKFETTFTLHRDDLAGLIPRFVSRGGRDVIYFDDFSIQEADLPPAPEFRFPEGVCFPGHPSRFHMRVERVEHKANVISVVTTGAEYLFDSRKRKITCRQRIGLERQVVAVDFAQPLGELSIAQNSKDVCVLQGDGVAFGVQGDSLITLATNRALDLTITSAIAAEHLATQGPHLLAVDEHGGFVVSHDFSQKYRTKGCVISDLPESFRSPSWRFQYRVGERERIGLAVFPPRPYDWKTSFGKRIVNVTGLLSDGAIRFYQKYCNVLMLFDAYRLYDQCRTPRPGRGPYSFLDPAGMRRTVKTAHDLGMQVMTYCNTSSELDLWYGDRTDVAFDYVASVTKDYGIDGWYFDGVFTGNGWSRAYSWMRRMRELVGPDGVLYTHCTLNAPLTRDDFYLPFIDAYNDFLLRGEGQAIKGVNDPYMRYVIGSYRISNAIPTLKWDKMEDAAIHDIFRAMLSLQGRFRWAYPTVPTDEPSWRGSSPERAAWDKEFMEFYFPELDRQEALWREGRLDMRIQWPHSAVGK